MIHGIGTDIVCVERIQANLKRFGERFARRVLTPEELGDFHKDSKPAHFLARRFAAKEAVAKALGTGFRDGLHLHHIGVGHDQYGRPLLEFHEQAAALRDALGIGAAYISLADEQDHAIAFVTLMRR